MCHKHDTTTNMSHSQNVLSSCLDSSNFLANLVIRLHFTPRSRIIPLVPSMPVALTNCMGISPSVLCSHVLFQFTGLWSHHIHPQMSDRPCVTPWMALPHYILLRASSAGHFFYNSYRWPQYFCTLLLLFLLLWLCCPTHQLSFSQLRELTVCQWALPQSGHFLFHGPSCCRLMIPSDLQRCNLFWILICLEAQVVAVSSFLFNFDRHHQLDTKNPLSIASTHLSDDEGDYLLCPPACKLWWTAVKTFVSGYTSTMRFKKKSF